MPNGYSIKDSAKTLHILKNHTARDTLGGGGGTYTEEVKKRYLVRSLEDVLPIRQTRTNIFEIILGSCVP